MRKKNSPLIRYKILDQCFRNTGRKYFFQDLTNAINNVLCEIDPGYEGISRRQLFDDIAFMESPEGWSVDLEKLRENRKVYYRYADTSFSINNMPLNEVEINELKSAVDILSQFKGMPQFESLYEIIPKLKTGLVSENPKPIMDFESNPYLKGIEFLGDFYNAIFYKKVLKVNYHPFDYIEPIELEFHPYYLKQYNNRWFVFGYNPFTDKYTWNLALDRIIRFEETKKSYQENTSIDWTEYFEDIIGVSKPEGVNTENVKLLFFGITGKYVESKPVHGSQKSKWLDKDTLEVNLEVIPNFELERLILSFGEGVKVTKPENLIAKIKSRFEIVKGIYK